MFLTPQIQLSKVKACSYLAATLSDHNPIKMELEVGPPEPASYRWRFRGYLLKEPECITFMNNHIDVYLETNLNSSSHSNIWEALKAYMRGHIMSYVAHKKKGKERSIIQIRKRHRNIGAGSFLDKKNLSLIML